MTLTRPVAVPGLFPGWECGGGFHPLPGPQACSARQQAGFSPDEAGVVPIPPYLPDSGVPRVPAGAWLRGKLGCARPSYFYSACPHRAVLWLQVTAWGAEPLPGLGVDELERQRLPTPFPRQHLILTLIQGRN